MNPSTHSVAEALSIVSSACLVNDSLKKLRALGVVASWKNGRDVTYSATETGGACVQRYRELPEPRLVDALDTDDALEPQHWRVLARTACSLGPVRPDGKFSRIFVNERVRQRQMDRQF